MFIWVSTCFAANIQTFFCVSDENNTQKVLFIKNENDNDFGNIGDDNFTLKRSENTLFGSSQNGNYFLNLKFNELQIISSTETWNGSCYLVLPENIVAMTNVNQNMKEASSGESKLIDNALTRLIGFEGTWVLNVACGSGTRFSSRLILSDRIGNVFRAFYTGSPLEDLTGKVMLEEDGSFSGKLDSLNFSGQLLGPTQAIGESADDCKFIATKN